MSLEENTGELDISMLFLPIEWEIKIISIKMSMKKINVKNPKSSKTAFLICWKHWWMFSISFPGIENKEKVVISLLINKK